MHYTTGCRSKQGGEESEKHSLLVPSHQQSVEQTDFLTFTKMVLFSPLNPICEHTFCTAWAPRPRSSPPAKVCCFSGISG